MPESAPHRSPPAVRAVTEDDVRAWIAEYRLSHQGRFPTLASGSIPGSAETWRSLDELMRNRARGWRGIPSLYLWLDRHYLERITGSNLLSLEQFRALVDAYRAAHHGDFPTRDAGPIAGIGATWLQLDDLFLQGGTSLPDLIGRYYAREVAISDENLRRWVDRYRREHDGDFPTAAKGPVKGTNTTWRKIEDTLHKSNTTLREWLDQHYPDERFFGPEQLNGWIAAHLEANGRFPDCRSREKVAPGSQWTWYKVNAALFDESYGWKGRTTLFKWIRRHFVSPGTVPVKPRGPRR